MIQKNSGGSHPVDKNKFVIYTNEGRIQEMTFYERSYNVLDFSSKGEICISLQNPNNSMADQNNSTSSEHKKYNLQTLNLNEKCINY
jgi:hypothetical protein